MKSTMKIHLYLSLFLLFIVGCAAQPIYYWGHYEELLYLQANEPGKANPQYQIEQMEADIDKAHSKNLPLPPGFYGHLGYQYLVAGNRAKALAGFEVEKKRFPESTTLMNRLTKKLK